MTTLEERAFLAKEYWEKRLSEKWNLEGVGHIPYGRPYNEWAYRIRKKVFLRQVCALPLDFPQVSVLDVGSGTGFWLEVWRSLGVRALTGLDVTDVAVRKLREKYPDVGVIQQDISDPKALPRKIGQFDVISAIDVLYHITSDRDYRQAISNIAALLKPNGHFIFSENLVHCKSPRERHWVSRTLDDVTQVLSLQGLRIQRRVPVFVCMNAPVDASSTVPRFLWQVAMAPVRFVPALGHLFGAALFPLELALTGLLREGPSTELVICQKASEEEDSPS
jgi:2-polyprenyl-3-methyl-5-hydroxy-6-metoxy-1,4-benzoquinol methylase